MLGISSTSQIGPIAVVTADASGTMGVSSSAGLSNLASFFAVRANRTAIMGNSALIADNSTLIASNSSAIMGLQDRQSVLFDSAQENSKLARRANEGVALALAMESPVIMLGKTFGVAGGFGYYNDRVAGSASFGLRVSKSSAVTGLVGIGFDSGEVGERAGLQGFS